MMIGYARVSTDDQRLDNQRTVLTSVGCQRIYEEKISGTKRERPELTRLLDHLREDDVLITTRLDRLARSTRDLLEIAEILNDRGVGLRSLAEPWIDTTSPSGKMVLTVFAGIAEFERSLIVDRTRTGRVAAQKKGVRFGRPPKLSTEQIAMGKRLIAEGTSVREAARLLNCHHATLYRAIGSL
ncbi:MAG: recombinase family protein [Moraxellaceae bacterium]|nr:recombinase family protein [Moraxellaceae bacterium]